ncbi:hypothetical protein AAFX91_00305 [Bradyrhizobium sp. 31Argb]|uniref:hypothetical protein n=1 Tax=Bradyrhizobium sp. 31Argb TaxID=3141247 RepID=UPI00374836EE
MTTDIITPTGAGSLVKQTRTDVATLMNSALAPFILQEQWCSSIQAARDAAPFLAGDKDGELVALSDNADWRASRNRALEIQESLPPPAEIEAAYQAVDQTLRVKPVSGEYQLLASKMLDVLGIKGGDDTDAYVEALAWTLSDVWRAKGDSADTPHWIPIPALAKAVDRVWQYRDSWYHFGGTKRPPLPDIVDHCKEYRRDLVNVRDGIDMLGRTRKRLSQIIRTVNAYETEEW